MKLIIFDCDGVVIDSMRLHAQVEASVYKEYGITVTPERLHTFAGMPMKDVTTRLKEEQNVTILADINIEAIIDQEKEGVFPTRLKAIPDIEVALDQLRDIPRCIASGSGVERLKQMLKIVNLYDDFAPHIYSSEMVERGKPAPDIFLHAAKQFHCDPRDCIVIEDGVPGVRAGVEAGMTVYGFTGGSHCDAEREKHAEDLIHAGAQHVFSNMSELPSLVNRLRQGLRRR